MRTIKHIISLAVLACLLTCNVSSAKIIYVDDDATSANNGSSWENAYVYLQDALADANDSQKPVEIRVAQGIYTPDKGANQTPGDREATFQLINIVSLMGGYAGCDANDPNVRDFELYETILSGDLEGNDGPDFANNDENSYHVVTGSGVDETAMLDGVTIIAGNADGTPEGELGWGGGMYNNNGSPTITNCTFNQNSARYGGGMLNDMESSSLLTHCLFSENLAAYHGGGGMYNRAYSTPMLANCVFTRNSARWGGAMYNGDHNSLQMINCTFAGNRTDEGGTLNNNKESDALVLNCTFVGNHSNSGAAGITCASASPTVVNCILWDVSPAEIDFWKGSITIMYCDVRGDWDGEGNIDEDPLFAEPGYWADGNDPNVVVEPEDPNAVWIEGDYHLKSEAGRWNPNTQTWVVDDVTSPCIDAGDPNTPVGDEPFPSGIRINMGAYGGTTEASKSFSDIPEVVNVNDSDNGSQVTLIQGQILAVTLESNPTTGYSWAPVEKQNSILEQFGDSLYFPSEPDDGTVGAGGWEIFYFRAVSAGQEILELIYHRPWETDVEPAKTFSIEVIVH